MSILIKCTVSCSFVIPVKFVIMKINAARKVAYGSISDLESSAHVPSFNLNRSSVSWLYPSSTAHVDSLVVLALERS